MSIDAKTPKLLGIAYLIQFVGSLLSDPLFTMAAGTGSISENLVSISNNLMMMRFFILSEIITGIGIIAMTVLLYVVLRHQNKMLAILALSFWLFEVTLLIISSICAYSLIPIGIEYVQMGTPDPSYFLTLGSLFLELKEFSFALHMMFFTLGGVLWYYLFYRAEYIPKGFTIFAIVVFPLMAMEVLMVILGVGFDSILRMILLMSFIPYLPFEGILGIWFIVKGIKNSDLEEL